jgi:selenide,water dikinase
MKIKLTEYSHGAGCGCKISPSDLETILESQLPERTDTRLLVGNHSRDDAAVYDVGGGQAVISTTDFFMPIVDDPKTFGRIAATNAISDVYAMGGRPVMAIAILGWPLDKLPAEVAQQVIEGGRQACADAGISLAGGHSIDAPEPIFGLAVTGLVEVERIKKNNTARPGDLLFLTKPLGIGILATAQKQKKLQVQHEQIAPKLMCQLNTFGAIAGQQPWVHAMTDVTGFALAGHLLEMCEGSAVGAEIVFDDIPVIAEARAYAEQGCVPGGTGRNFAAYGHKLPELNDWQKTLLCDPQTSGGLLIAVDPAHVGEFLKLAEKHDVPAQALGRIRCQPGIKLR